MAGNRHGNVVGGAGASDGAHRARLTNSFGNFGIACCRPKRDATERLPNAMLESSPLHVEGKVKAETRLLDKGNDLVGDFLKVSTRRDQSRVRELLLQIALQ